MKFFNWFSRKRNPKLEPIAPIEEEQSDCFEPIEQMLDEIEQTEMNQKRPLLYMFQYVALPEAAFQNHPELMNELEGEQSCLPFLHFRSKAELYCIQAGLISQNQEQDVIAAENDLFKMVRVVHSYKRNGYTVHVLIMPTPLSIPEAHFVAIVHNDNEPKGYMQESPSTRYITLEKGFTLPILGECLRDGSHQNYGEISAPEISVFVEAIFKLVLC